MRWDGMREGDERWVRSIRVFKKNEEKKKKKEKTKKTQKKKTPRFENGERWNTRMQYYIGSDYGDKIGHDAGKERIYATPGEANCGRWGIGFV